MSRTFTSIKYVGGLQSLDKTMDLNVIVDPVHRQLIFKKYQTISVLNFEDIVEISLNEKATRSGGKAAAGAIIGGVLTGGIGLLAGAAIGGRKRDASTLFITHKKYGKQTDLLLKAKGKTDDLYAAISSAISTDAPTDFDYSRTPVATPETPVTTELTTGGRVVLIVAIIIVLLIIKTCS